MTADHTPSQTEHETTMADSSNKSTNTQNTYSNLSLQTETELRNKIKHQISKHTGVGNAINSYATMKEINELGDEIMAIVDDYKASFLERALVAVGEDESKARLESPTWNIVGGQNELRAEIRTKLNQEFGGK